MSRATHEGPLPPTASKLRLVLQCREPGEVRACEHIAFAFARDAGLRGVDVWYVAACASELANHALQSGGGELELTVGETPRAALVLRLRHAAPVLAATPVALHLARSYVSELLIEWQPQRGTVITARRWLSDGS
jgi:hypothetical protein